jgi:hypothetical protein
MARNSASQQQPQAGRGEEGEHQEQRRVHRVARGDDAQRRDAQHRGEDVEAPNVSRTKHKPKRLRTLPAGAPLSRLFEP